MKPPEEAQTPVKNGPGKKGRLMQFVWPFVSKSHTGAINTFLSKQREGFFITWLVMEMGIKGKMEKENVPFKWSCLFET